MDEFDDDEDDPIDEIKIRCGCEFCWCLTDTDYGHTCSDCLNGAHQG